MDVDVDYAVKQLRGISMESLNQSGQYNAADRVQRALDALERVQESLRRIAVDEATANKC